MAGAFARAAAAVHADTNVSLPAVFRAAGSGDVPLRVIRTGGEQAVQAFGFRQTTAAALSVHILQSDVPGRPQRGDALTLDGILYRVAEVLPDQDDTVWIASLSNA